MNRILVIGTSGTGKSTLAQRLSKRLGLPFFATDGFYWEPGWKLAPLEKVHRRVSGVIRQDAWVLDGNFDDEHAWVWKRADCIIWLDYSLMTILSRVVFRNFRWVMTRQTTWSGNRMTVSRAISGIRHAINSYALKKRNYPQWLAELSGIATYQFRASHEAETWFQGLSQRAD